MWIVRLALRRPYTIAVLCSLIAIFGLLSTSRMKTDILPAIDIPVVIVSVSLTASRIMPPGITPPAIIRYNASNVPVAQLTISSKTLSEQELYDYSLNFIRLRLFTILGLATPAPFGGKSRQIMVDIDPARVASKAFRPTTWCRLCSPATCWSPPGRRRSAGPSTT